MVTQKELLIQLGNPYTNRVVERLHRFMYIKDDILQKLAKEALNEHWGKDSYALEKYLAVQIPWSIEQGLFSVSVNQWYLSAGNLQTRYGTPLYLVIERNNYLPEKAPWYVKAVGSMISAPLLPTSPAIPTGPAIPRGAETQYWTLEWPYSKSEVIELALLCEERTKTLCLAVGQN